MEKVNLGEKLALFADHWSPKVVGELNGQHVKLVKFVGEFVWHKHDHEDELFLVVTGRFTMEFRDRHVALEAGEFLIVPRGVEHRPVADEEVIPAREGWLYLAVVEDLFSRMVVGWATGATMTSRLVVDALGTAVTRRRPGEGLLAHSDRGSQYASEHYQRVLSGEGIMCSMSRRGDCWDNAPMESFFARLKNELVHREVYATREQAKASIFEYIEAFYNRERRHSTRGYVSPADLEAANPECPLTPCPHSVGNSIPWGTPLRRVRGPGHSNNGAM